MKSRRSLVAAGVALLFCQMSMGTVPSLINYQGRLTDSNGNPITTNVSVILRIYPAQSGGSPAYTETIGTVAVQSGIYSFQFGTNSAGLASALSNATSWVEVSINGTALTPRQQLVSVPFALTALNVINTNVNTKVGPEFVITDYGAVGNAAFDNAPIINQLLSQMPAAGGTIVIPHGEFLINSPVVISNSFITIRGLNYGQRSNVDVPVPGLTQPGGGSKLLVGGAKGIQIPSNPSSRISGITIKDLQVEGTSVGSGATGISIERNNDGVRIENITGINLFKAIYMNNPDATRISDCWVAEVSNCLDIENGQQVLVNNCHFGARPNGLTCLFVNQVHLLFTGNVVFPDGYTALRLTGSSYCTVSANNFSSYYTGVIEMDGTGNSIMGNTIGAFNNGASWSADPIGRDGNWGMIRMSGDDNYIGGCNLFSQQPVNDIRVHCLSGNRNCFSSLNIAGNASNRKVRLEGNATQATRIMYCGTSGEIDLGGASNATTVNWAQ